MSNKQSSIDWLVSQILVEYATYFNEEGDLVDKPINQFFNAYQGSVNLIEYVNKAKEMHKQEMKEMFLVGIKISTPEMAEEYYDKTFGE